jgi:carboxypeptidase Taq
MTEEAKLARLKELLHEYEDLYFVEAVLGWDQQTYMPAGGTEGRGSQLATISKIAHQKFTSPEIGSLLDSLQSYAAGLDPDSDDACLIRVTTREYQKQVKVPESLVGELAQVTTLAQTAWMEARAAKDFKIFQPHLENIVELRRRYADLFAPYQHVYDPLLDDFEPGLKTAEVQTIFARLRSEQVDLIHKISTRPQVDDSFLHIPLDEKKQWDFGVNVITRMGFDWNRGRQDRSQHPFTTSFGTGDVRITTHTDAHMGISSLFSSVHESGHALYEQGFSSSLTGTLLANGASMAVHESQSRMWENLVARSRAFWTFFFPQLQATFPEAFSKVDLESFYRGINLVTPSLIRTESDEATYNLHIMLRLELEIAMMEGSLAVRDLPAAWNQRMHDYLGVVPEDDVQGVLQDIHWSGASIGYFPTYALGNLISVQIWNKMESDLPQLDEQIRSGDFHDLLAWLRKNVHQHGAKFEPQDLVKRVTGSKIDPEPYLKYLRTKYGEIYGL